jgi:hypothetical protein
MLESVDTLAVFFLAALFTAALLAMGMTAGYRVGLRVGARLVPPAPGSEAQFDLAERLNVCRTLTDGLEQKAQAVRNLSVNDPKSLPPGFWQALDELAAAVKDLSTQLALVEGRDSRETPAAQPESPPPEIRSPLSDMEAVAQQVPPPEPPPSDSNKLSGEEIQSFTMLAGEPLAKGTDCAKQRFRYECQQIVHPWYDDERREPIGPGVMSRCHDISVHGISFFWPDLPDYDRLIISLGSGDKIVFMACQIMHTKAVYMHGEVCYVVGCRFTGRVPEFNEDCRVRFNMRRARGTAYAEPVSPPRPAPTAAATPTPQPV